jgi:hypothetical protein
MAMHFSTDLRNGILDYIETYIGPSAILKLRSGASPGDGDVPSTGTVIATMNLPADWMANASGGSKGLQGVWQDLAADAAGTVGHYELCTSAGTPKIRDSVTLTGAGGGITLDAVTLNLGQAVSISSWTLVAPNA